MGRELLGVRRVQQRDRLEQQGQKQEQELEREELDLLRARARHHHRHLVSRNREVCRWMLDFTKVGSAGRVGR